MRKSVKRAAVITTALALTAGGATAAWAAWTADGEFVAKASATKAEKLVLTADSVTGLYPTASKSVTVNVENKNPYAVNVTSLKTMKSGLLGLTVQVTAASVKANPVTALCNANQAVSFTFAAGTQYIAPNSSANIAGTVAMSNDANDACQGAEFQVTVDADGASTQTKA